MTIKNGHRPDCLLLHGWKVVVTDRFLKETADRTAKAFISEGVNWTLAPMPNYVWRSPRNALYGSHSILHVPDEAWNDATEHGDFNETK